MLVADRIIALGIIALSAYFMWHATVLPIGWNAMTGGPGGGAFPFWLSGIMMLAALSILLRSFRAAPDENRGPFFDRVMLPAVLKVTAALIITIAVIPWLGTYIALAVFVFWYVKIYGRHSWGLAITLSVGIQLFLFFFFEATLKILLPKGITEPLFFPLYAMFF